MINLKQNIQKELDELKTKEMEQTIYFEVKRGDRLVDIKIQGKSLVELLERIANKTDKALEVEEGGEVSDGYHTFNELYDHRITLFIALCKNINEILSLENPGKYKIWKSKRHSDGELCFGTGTQFVMGIGEKVGQQISYHIPIDRWNETYFVEEFEKAPHEFDGHTSEDVLTRIKDL